MGVKVKIFGQEYIIAGEESPEEIQKIAEYVDNKMRIISRMTGNEGLGQTATLTALNVAEEYFETLEKLEQQKAAAEKAKKDVNHYIKMLEETKTSYISAKEQLDKLKSENKNAGDQYRELEKKCSEFENSIFDLQMENIQLKSELEKQDKR